MENTGKIKVQSNAAEMTPSEVTRNQGSQLTVKEGPKSLLTARHTSQSSMSRAGPVLHEAAGPEEEMVILWTKELGWKIKIPYRRCLCSGCHLQKFWTC